ncbi:MAG TPA: hypothetical protein VHV77_16800 [Pirellulales bacterium]|jgi:hypothetical protein|nr:hypothetical protein [Pirellulales bacterium]
MARRQKQRRQSHGAAWFWKQTGCWYFTPQGTKKRAPLFDQDGQRIRGKDNRDAAERALALVRVSNADGEGKIEDAECELLVPMITTCWQLGRGGS